MVQVKMEKLGFFKMLIKGRQVSLVYRGQECGQGLSIFFLVFIVMMGRVFKQREEFLIDGFSLDLWFRI